MLMNSPSGLCGGAGVVYQELIREGGCHSRFSLCLREESLRDRKGLKSLPHPHPALASAFTSRRLCLQSSEMKRPVHYLIWQR